MSGTLRSTLDVFDEYEDAEIVSAYVYDLGAKAYYLFSTKRSGACI